MRYSIQVKPISFLKANAAEVLATLSERRVPLVITRNGEAKAVLQDMASFEATQETLALLKVLALGNQEVAAGRVKPIGEVVSRLKAKKALTELQSGQTLKVISTDPGSWRDFEAFARQTGNALLSQEKTEANFVYVLQRR